MAADHRPPMEERFWAKVDKNGPIPEHRPELGPCWQWTASLFPSGYGYFRIDETRRRAANRVAWELTNGPIPDGLCVLHHCDNPPCVNPGHFFLGTKADNAADMVAKGRSAVPYGELHYNAKLSAEDVATIRARLLAGESQSSLSRTFAVGRTQIRRIQHGESWKSVKDQANA